VPDLDVLYMGVVGETVTDLSPRLLREHAGFRGPLRTARGGFFCAADSLSPPPVRSTPGRSSAG
jgi:hypothetical protein